MPQNFWIDSAINWELQRYQGFFSRILFSSLHYRRDYLVSILEQLPDSARVLELGCGSGLLFAAQSNPGRLRYTGYDISPSAIQAAQKKFSKFSNATWICDSVENIKNAEADIVISAGLVDWVSDEILQIFLRQNQIRFFAHSFSEDRKTAGTLAHRLFSKMISVGKKISYSPRKRSEKQIKNILGPDIVVIRDKLLSFGAFAVKLPTGIDSVFASSRVKAYFFQKKQKQNSIETRFKKIEMRAVINALPTNLNTLRVLEIGSGAGLYSRALFERNPAELLCLDPHVSTVDFVPELADRFKKISLESLNEPKIFDLLLALGVLEFSVHPESFVACMLQHAAPGAQILMLVPKASGPLRLIYSLFHLTNGIRLAADPEARLLNGLALTNRKFSFQKINTGFLNFLYMIKLDG